ncbi:hypothetical protein BDQ17DRAFT_1430407 [Cyathus striatus]|nr:hypothetical protein BDQ17DRAFT_1430407 [Cyathus striatus]
MTSDILREKLQSGMVRTWQGLQDINTQKRKENCISTPSDLSNMDALQEIYNNNSGTNSESITIDHNNSSQDMAMSVDDTANENITQMESNLSEILLSIIEDDEILTESKNSDDILIQTYEDKKFPENNDITSNSDYDSIEDDPDIMDTETDAPESQNNFSLPDTLLQLHRELLGDYRISTSPPGTYDRPRPLDESEQLSLQHFIAWRDSNGTKTYGKLDIVPAKES